MSGTSKKRLSTTTSGMKSMPGESPWPKRLGALVGISVVIGLVALMLFNSDPISGVPEGTETIAVTTAEHINGTIYRQGEVPAGGAMDAAWANCGYYDAPFRTENVVHSLEHGAVWISYVPDLDSDQIDRLKRFTGGVDKVLVSPVPGQDAQIIATAWGFQLKLTDANDQRLEQFVNEFERGRNAPEAGALCRSGVGNPIG
ncbi:MAG: hypothetical protein BMS9Abin12_2049 [Acidimicrobiia bacterium]|nr:MAG: hypothetical protein BMS9Abin12_2049 [Acidimicrobiia bacterium]